MKVGEIILRIPVNVEFEPNEGEYQVGGTFYAQAGEPEIVSHTLNEDDAALVARELETGDFWADAHTERFLPPVDMSDIERNALLTRVNDRYLADAYPDPGTSVANG